MPRNPVPQEDKRLVRRLLKRGKANAVSARKLANETNLRSDRTDIHIRSVISALIAEDGMALGSCSRGYYIISTDEELTEVRDGLRARIRGMVLRRSRISRNYHNT